MTSIYGLPQFTVTLSCLGKATSAQPRVRTLGKTYVAKLYQCPKDWKQVKDLQHQVRTLMRKQHDWQSNILTATEETAKWPPIVLQ